MPERIIFVSRGITVLKTTSSVKQSKGDRRRSCLGQGGTLCRILTLPFLWQSRDSSADIVTKLWAGQQSKRGSIPDGGKILLSKTSGLSLGVTQLPIQSTEGGKATTSVTDCSILQLRLRMGGDLLPLPNTTSCRAQGLLFLSS